MLISRFASRFPLRLAGQSQNAVRRSSAHKLLRLATIILLLVCSLLFSTTAPADAQASKSGSPQCQKLFVKNIALTGESPADKTIYAELCHPRTGPARTVQILIHGATYSHLYWDWPNLPGHSDWSFRYSGVRYFTDAGYSTLTIDRIGIGKSSHPAGSEVNVDTNSYVFHQLVERLKKGDLGGKAFRHVILVGHSLGSAIAMVEAATYHDVDGVVLTGLLHQASIVTRDKITAATIPANQDPSGRFAGLDSNYQTTVPGTRGSIFYYAPGSDSAVIDYDEQTKETRTLPEILQLRQYLLSNISAQITVPVLVVVGEHDELFCAADAVDCSSNASVFREEAPFFAPQAHLQVQVIPHTAHDLNLHYTARLTYSKITAWAFAHVRP